MTLKILSQRNRRLIMRMKIVFVVLLSALLFLSGVPIGFALTKPTVIIPDNWYLKSDLTYPQGNGQHDPQGAGQLEYEAQDLQGFVVINYEDAMGASYSNESLSNEALTLLQTHQNSIAISGTEGVAGVIGGYAICQQGSYYYWEFVFVKGGIYFDVYIGYDESSGHDLESLLLVNSVEIDSQVTTPPDANMPVGLGVLGFVGEIVIAGVLVVLIVQVLRKDFLMKKAEP